MRIAICEDIKSDQEMLYKALVETKLFSEPEVDYYDNGQALVEKCRGGFAYDFVFLDVAMPEMDGIEAGKIINTISPKTIIIFITAYPQFAIDAFDCNAFNYLLKSSDNKRFYSVISRAVEKYRTYHKIYPINAKNGMVKLNISDIYYIECCQKRLYFHLADEVYEAKMKLSEACDFLVPYGFFRVHQGYIVNLEKITSVDGYEIRLENGEKVFMSVRKHTDVIKAYSEYLERCM